jgi:hypothetical protein
MFSGSRKNLGWLAAIGWLALLIGGAAAALLVVWLGHLVSVSGRDLLAGAGIVAGICWLVALVTVPWNLFFAARRAQAEMAVSRERGIDVREADGAEAAQIARRMLRFAIGAHVATAVAAALVAYLTGDEVGYYVAAIFVVATGIRPAAEYLAHIRKRIGALTLEMTHPRDDVVALKERVDLLEQRGRATRRGLQRVETALADGLAHASGVLTADLARLADAQADDRAATRSRDDDLDRRIDAMVRRMEAALDGISDHQELLTGLRALVRMIRSDQA